MSYSPTAYTPVALLEETDRVAFMVKVYQHLGLALASFMAFEYLYICKRICRMDLRHHSWKRWSMAPVPWYLHARNMDSNPNSL